jgi:hypothetical protein
VLTLTPEVWRLARSLGSDDYGYGVYLDGEYAVATDGVVLFAQPCPGPSLPATWRLRSVHPRDIPASASFPATLGVHATRTEEPMGKNGRKKTAVAVVEIVDEGMAFPDWRAILRMSPPPASREGYKVFSTRNLLDFLITARCVEQKEICLGIHPGNLGPVYLMRDGVPTMFSDTKPVPVAVIMPVRP